MRGEVCADHEATNSGKFSNYCTNCTVHASRMLTCACTPLIHGEKGPIKSTLNLGMFPSLKE